MPYYKITVGNDENFYRYSARSAYRIARIESKSNPGTFVHIHAKNTGRLIATVIDGSFLGHVTTPIFARMMGGILAKDTKPEVKARLDYVRNLHEHGPRWRKGG